LDREEELEAQKVKKTLITFLVFVLLTTAGCGIFNISSWVMPDDLEFMQIVNELDSPQKICDYLKDNFTYKYNPYYSPSPYEFWLEKEGDCNDFADFGRWVAFQQGIEAYRYLVHLQDTIVSHAMTVYVVGGLYDYQNVTQYVPLQTDSFGDIVIDWQSKQTKYEWTSYKVYDWDNNLIEKGVR